MSAIKRGDKLTERHAVVFSVGAGVCAVSVVVLDQETSEVVASLSDNTLGGDDLVHKLMHHLLGEAKDQNFSSNAMFVQKLRHEVEFVLYKFGKEPKHPKVKINVELGKNIFCSVITNEQFKNFSQSIAADNWLYVPQSKAVLIGEDVLLNCVVRSDDQSPIVYSWYQGNQSIPEHFSLYANHSLLIPRITHNELGTYYCTVVSNSSRIISPEAAVIEAYISEFLVHPQSVRTAEKDVVTFECVSGESAPYPDVFWELNGVRFKGGNQSRTTYGDYDETGLRIQYSLKLVLVLETQFVGVIRCAAENRVLGKSVYSHSANITIAATPGSPVIEIPPPPRVVVSRGWPVMLPCSVTGYPWARTVWFKDGVFIDGSANSYVAANGSFIFVSVSAADSGIYICKGVNSVGETTSPTCNVTVTYLDIAFPVEPEGLTVFAGQSATLHCTPPDSYPPASVSWYKDYQPITAAVSQSVTDTVISTVSAMSVLRTGSGGWNLFLPSVQKSDAGRYFCVAINSLSSPTSRTSPLALLHVVGAPTITEPPVDTRIVKGRLLHLVCRVEADPTPEIDWKFLGQSLKASAHVSFRDRKQELYISNMNKAWDGVFTCLATNKYGSKTVEATVTVIVPPVTLNPIGHLIVKAGQQLLLPCDVYGIPTPTLTWFHDGLELEPRKGMVFLESALFINSVVEEDRGTYSCSAQNEAGSTQASGNITVLLPPSITQGPQDTEVLIGQSAVFSCSVHAYPKPTVDWLYNSSLALPEGVSVESHDLKIQSVSWKNVGVYTCVANNSEGSVNKSAVLKITVPPHIMEVQGSVAVDTGEAIKLTCVFGGVPQPSVKWMHQGEIIKTSLDGRISFPSQDVLLVKFSTNTDAGVYSCHVANSVGSAVKKITVYVIEPPYPPVLTSAVAVSMSSIYLEWLPNTQEPMTNVTGYAVHMKKLVEEDFLTFPGRLSPQLTSYEVEELKPGTEYIFTVSAVNTAGLGKPSNALSVKTFESGPSEPRFFEVKATDSTSISLFWEVPSVENGEVRLYQLQSWEKSLPHNTTSVDIVNPTMPSQEYMIKNLHPHTAYVMRVRAANIEGSNTLWGNFTQTIEAQTDIAAPSVAPTGLEVTTVDPYTVQIKWTPLTNWEENGPMIGYRVTYKQQGHVTIVEKMVSNATTTVVSQLSPWTEYSFVVEAVNSAGRGPPSDVTGVRTLPTAPTAAPQNVQVKLIFDTTITVTWQPPPTDEQNSELAGYFLQYRRTGDLTWKPTSTTSSHTRDYNISDLDYWTEYEIEVAAYTNQVTPGLGSFSDVVHIKTDQGTPGPVEISFINATSSSVYLDWLPPKKANGKLTYYHVIYYVVHSSHNQSTSELGYVGNTSVKVSQVTLFDLEPDTTYKIFVFANTAAGEGTPLIVLQKTDQDTLLPPSTEYITTDSLESSTGHLVGSMDDNTKQRLAVIVAGSLTGGIIMLFILALIIYRCLRKRREEIRKYMTSAVSGIKISRRSSSTYDRHFDEAVDESACDISPSPSPSHSAQDSRTDYGSCDVKIESTATCEQTTAVVTPYSTSAPQNQTEVLDVSALDKPGIRRKSNSFREDLVRNKTDPVFTTSDRENPGYHDDTYAATLPRPRTTNHMSADEFYSQMLTMPRKNRMRSESAAAIAVLRNSTMNVTTSDTESLVTNEVVVVFKERTVL
ncbi:Down syndrome cell adhesion molecule homolog [Gigantopelta aegis]|uniref:Down syndrome cell adhesion molecule homolog n=1 Tax=Gigantopelta aegis TaxID=1735272 RepID=UPI001B88E496|nr:Down syndrome cell adhesion molecule homolog [Gigantopelta aegis]